MQVLCVFAQNACEQSWPPTNGKMNRINGCCRPRKSNSLDVRREAPRTTFSVTRSGRALRSRVVAVVGGAGELSLKDQSPPG